MFAFALATYIVLLTYLLLFVYTKWCFNIMFEETMKITNGMLQAINDEVDDEFNEDPTL